MHIVWHKDSTWFESCWKTFARKLRKKSSVSEPRATFLTFSFPGKEFARILVVIYKSHLIPTEYSGADSLYLVVKSHVNVRQYDYLSHCPQQKDSGNFFSLKKCPSCFTRGFSVTVHELGFRVLCPRIYILFPSLCL